MFVPNFSIFLYTDGSQIWSLNLPNTRYELILIYSVKKKIQRHVLAQFDPQCMGSVTLILYTKSNPIHKNVGLSMELMPGGGGGGVLPYCILGRPMCRARDPNFQPWISVPEHVIFTNFPKIRSGASPFYILGADFAVPGPSFSKFL